MKRSNQLVLKFSLFDDIHITQEGAVVYGSGRTVSVEYCFFNDVVTTNGGSCIDLSSSPSLIVGSSCFSRCKNTNSNNDSFANAVKFVGNLLNISKISSTQCADSTRAGDSSIVGDCTNISMNDSNASSNYSPFGASSLSARGQSISYVERCIDSNSALFTVFEFENDGHLSYLIVLNTTQNQCIFNAGKIYLNWCIFIDQCSMFGPYKPITSDHCYSDEIRTELSSTVTETFDIHINNINFHQCLKNVEDNRRECSSSGGSLKIGKMMILFLSLFGVDVLSVIRSSSSSSALNLKTFPSLFTKLDSLPNLMLKSAEG